MKNIKFLLVLALGVFTMVSCKSTTSETTVETTEVTTDSTTIIQEEATAPVVDSTMTPAEVPADSSKM